MSLHNDIVVSMVPEWMENGLLPAGVHPASWAEVEGRFGWNAHRQSLLLGLRDGLAVLRRAGCERLWLDGSFVTSKELPSDYDGCWAHDNVSPGLLDPILLNLRPGDRQAIKSRYLGDLLVAGLELGSGLTFVEFFQRSRDGERKGIVLLNPQEFS